MSEISTEAPVISDEHILALAEKCDIVGCGEQVVGFARVLLNDKAVQEAFVRAMIDQRGDVQWYPTDDELTNIYYKANNLDPSRHHAITTKRVFTAMRAMLKARPDA